MMMKTATNACSRVLRALGLAAVVGAGVLAAGCNIPKENYGMQQRERGIAAYNRAEYDVAATHFRNAIDAMPMSFRHHYWLGKTELAAGRPVAAQSHYEYAWTLRSDDPAWTPKLLDGIAESMYQQNNRDQLHNFLAQTSSEYGKTADYLREAKYLVKTGDPDNAVIAYRKAARLAKRGDAKPYIAIAEFYESVNDVPNAVTSLRYAYYLDPDNKAIADKFRQFGIVPGPTLKLEPPKPELLD